jgi:predicted MFS family arabinose efflux permease
MLAMVGFGVGEVLGCFFIGFIVDKFGSKAASVCMLIIILTLAAFTIAFILIY